MARVSIIIPSRAEKPENLTRTLESIRDNATGDIEVIVGLDGEPYGGSRPVFFEERKNIFFPSVVGIKANINAMASMATGKYLFKLDAHTSVGRGFDEILQQDMQDDWVVTPRFYVLNGETWEWQDERFYDYFYLCNPFTDPRGFRFKAGGHWPGRTAERLTTPIDETPQIHGSGWFMTRDRFFELGGFPNIDPHGHGQEPIWLGLKNWLAGGKVMVNKNTWYAHMHQDGHKRGYPEDKEHTERTYNLTAEYWVGDRWCERKRDFTWFIDKFNDMPGWQDWRKQYDEYLRLHSQ